MKTKALSGLLIIGFSGLAIFGFWLMHGSWNEHLGLCIASISGMALCPANDAPAIHLHLNALHSFFNALPVLFIILGLIAAGVLGRQKKLPQFMDKTESAYHSHPYRYLKEIKSLFTLAPSFGGWLVQRQREAVVL